MVKCDGIEWQVGIQRMYNLMSRKPHDELLKAVIRQHYVLLPCLLNHLPREYVHYRLKSLQSTI